MIADIIKAIVAAVLAYFSKKKGDQQQRQDDKNAGAQEAAAETDQTTKEIADARSEIAARPDDAMSVAARLRAKAARGRGGSAGPSSSNKS